MRQLQKEMEELKRQLSEQGDETGSDDEDASGGMLRVRGRMKIIKPRYFAVFYVLIPNLKTVFFCQH